MTRDASIWKEPFRVHAYEIDPHGQASLQTLCNYVQEAAGRHAMSFGADIEQLLEQGLTWVLSRLRIQIDAYPGRNDEVVVETWPSGVQGLLATREFLLRSGEEEIGRGSSGWLVVDAVRKRPARVPPFISDLKVPDRSAPLPDAFSRPPRFEPDAEGRRFRVRYSDLDVNRHVNNVRYAEWAVEGVSEDILDHFQPRDLELYFRAETVLGDTVLSFAQRSPSNEGVTFLHQLVREADGQEVAAARTHWVTRSAET